MLSHFLIFSVCLSATLATVLPPTTTLELMDNTDLYSMKPNEIVPIQPVLIYPPAKQQMTRNPYTARAMYKDNDIIYIKLLKRKNYRPKKSKNQIDERSAPKEIQMKDIFYVKALANGQFSHNRLKLYRLPEFYAITVYKKGQLFE
ncbi:uncharacterized protein ACRADG_012776 [Cochliomyia hominivorax]